MTTQIKLAKMKTQKEIIESVIVFWNFKLMNTFVAIKFLNTILDEPNKQLLENKIQELGNLDALFEIYGKDGLTNILNLN